MTKQDLQEKIKYYQDQLNEVIRIEELEQDCKRQNELIKNELNSGGYSEFFFWDPCVKEKIHIIDKDLRIEILTAVYMSNLKIMEELKK